MVIAIGTVIFIIYAYNAGSRQEQDFNEILRQQQQHSKNFERDLYDACMRNPGQCGAG